MMVMTHEHPMAVTGRQGSPEVDPNTSGDTNGEDWALGPGSITWAVLRDPAVFVVGLLREAIFLTLHPPFAAAAADHDSFNDDPVMRFKRVAWHTYGAAYGTKADAEHVSSYVRARHEQIVGVEPTTGLPYRAGAEYELALTSTSLTASFLAVHEELHGELASAHRDQFIREQQVGAAMLGVHPSHLPSTYGELEDFLGTAARHFATGFQAREILGPFGHGDYPVRSSIGQLPLVKREATMFAARSIADMALLTMPAEIRALVAIDRRPKLGHEWFVRRSLRLLSAYLQSDRGMETFLKFLGDKIAPIVERALAAEDAPGARNREATFEVPDADRFYTELPDLLRNWPITPDNYRLGQSDGERQTDGPPRHV